MAAAKGNTYAKKYQTKEERLELCEQWCEHLASGYSKEAFVPCDVKTVERVIRDHPEDFPPEKVSEARRRRRLFWEKVGIDGMFGNIDGFNATTWIFNMKNRFDWKDKTDNTHSGNLTLNGLRQAIGRIENEDDSAGGIQAAKARLAAGQPVLDQE